MIVITLLLLWTLPVAIASILLFPKQLLICCDNQAVVYAFNRKICHIQYLVPMAHYVYTCVNNCILRYVCTYKNKADQATHRHSSRILQGPKANGILVGGARSVKPLLPRPDPQLAYCSGSVRE